MNGCEVFKMRKETVKTLKELCERGYRKFVSRGGQMSFKSYFRMAKKKYNNGDSVIREAVRRNR